MKSRKVLVIQEFYVSLYFLYVYFIQNHYSVDMQVLKTFLPFSPNQIEK
jgi:hypothetical protein